MEPSAQGLQSYYNYYILAYPTPKYTTLKTLTLRFINSFVELLH